MLPKTDIPFNAQHQQTALGPMIILKSPYGISSPKAISYQNKTIITCNYYTNSDGYSYGYSYKVIYIMLDSDLQNYTSYIESDGYLPTFFINPDGKLYTSIEVYHPDKYGLITMLPCFERDNITYPKPKKMLPSDYIGIFHNFAMFKYVNIFSTKQLDKLVAVEFKDGELKKPILQKFLYQNIMYLV